MTLSCLMATAMIKTISAVGAELSNTDLNKRLVMFGWNLGRRKNDFTKKYLIYLHLVLAGQNNYCWEFL